MKAYVFFLLNVVRLLSIVFLCLAFAGIVVLMHSDVEALHSYDHGLDDEDLQGCEYVPDSDIPLSTWGIFWLFLDRTILLAACLVGVLCGE